MKELLKSLIPRKGDYYTVADSDSVLTVENYLHVTYMLWRRKRFCIKKTLLTKEQYEKRRV